VTAVADARARTLSAHAWVLAAASGGSLLASPYALALPHYYASTILEPSFGRYLVQWQPTRLSVVSLPLFLLAGWLLWQFGRAGSAYSTFEKLAALGLLAGALLAIRNWVWFSLFALMILPLGVRWTRSDDEDARLNRPLAVAALGGVLAFAVAGFAHSSDWFSSHYAPRAADAVASIADADADASVYATVASADWLLWQHPDLAGRIAYDARYELLEKEELRQIYLFRAAALGLRSKLARYDLLVLSRFADTRPLAALHALGHRVSYVYSDRDIVIVSRRDRARAAARRLRTHRRTAPHPAA